MDTNRVSGVFADIFLHNSTAQVLYTLYLPLHLPLPAIVALFPFVGQIDNRAGLPNGFQSLEGILDNLHLEVAVERFPDRMPQWKVYENRPRRLHQLGYVPCRACRDSWYPILLHYPSDQSYGLMANRSRGNKKQDIHPFLLQPLRYL